MEKNLSDMGTKKLVMMISEKTDELSSMFQEYSNLSSTKDPEVIKSKEPAMENLMDEINYILNEIESNRRHMDIVILTKVNQIPVDDILADAKNSLALTEAGIEIVHKNILNEIGEP